MRRREVEWWRIDWVKIGDFDELLGLLALGVHLFWSKRHNEFMRVSMIYDVSIHDVDIPPTQFLGIQYRYPYLPSDFSSALIEIQRLIANTWFYP